MLNFPKDIIPKSREERKQIDKSELEKRDLFQQSILNNVDKLENIPTIRKLPTYIVPLSQKYSRYSSLPYGKISNIKDAGCGILAVEYALRLLGFNVDFEKLVNETVNKGYRGYIRNDNDEIIEGNGTKYSLFNNLAIELTNINEIFNYLEKGCPITILIQNSIYHNDRKRTGSHFITLIGTDRNEDAILMDGNKMENTYNSTSAIVRMNFRQMLLGLRGAWAWEKEKVMTYLN